MTIEIRHPDEKDGASSVRCAGCGRRREVPGVVRPDDPPPPLSKNEIREVAVCAQGKSIELMIPLCARCGDTLAKKLRQDIVLGTWAEDV